MNEKETERLLKNYRNARKSWEGWCYLNDIDLKKDNTSIKNYVDKNELLFHCRYLLLKDLHIELYKIIKDKESTSRDNIFKLLRNINNEQSKTLVENLNNFKSELNSITNVRDKFYAHLDENYEDFLESFSIENYYKTFEFIESAIIILGKEKELLESLKTIPSRDEFKINN
jgi:hypothetical protein